MPLAEYAGLYSVNLRTIKRWKADGLSKSDETPLADPEAMLAWWQRNMKLRVPPGISAAVIEWRKSGKSITPADAAPHQESLPLVAAPKPVKDTDRQATLDQPVGDDEIGLEQTLRRLAMAEVRLSRVATDPGQTKAWLDTVSRMSSAAEKLRQEEERQGKLIPRDRAEMMIHEFHRPVEREIRLMLRSMCELLGLPISPEREDLWNRECDRLFARFKEEVFR